MDTARPAGVLASGTTESSRSALREYDCVELYLPKRLAYLSGLYAYLHSRLQEPGDQQARAFVLDGFSIYEVDGAWRDQATEAPVSDERTLVIRVLVQHNEESDPEAFRRKISELAQDVAALAADEKAIFISYHRQCAFTYFPNRDK
jgi:hypothetical protein